MAALSDFEYLYPVESFVESVKYLQEERLETGSDISSTLLVEIQQLLISLGKQLSELRTDQLSDIHKKFQEAAPILKSFAKDSALWGDDEVQQVRLSQTIATINNITNDQAIPADVKCYSSYHGDALKWGLITLQQLDLPADKIPTPQIFAINYAFDQLNPYTVSEETGLYLIRPSSSVSSTSFLKVFTLSFKIGSGPVRHQRLYYQKDRDHGQWYTKTAVAFTFQSLIEKILKLNGASKILALHHLTKSESEYYSSNRYVNLDS